MDHGLEINRKTALNNPHNQVKKCFSPISKINLLLPLSKYFFDFKHRWSYLPSVSFDSPLLILFNFYTYKWIVLHVRKTVVTHFKRVCILTLKLCP